MRSEVASACGLCSALLLVEQGLNASPLPRASALLHELVAQSCFVGFLIEVLTILTKIVVILTKLVIVLAKAVVILTKIVIFTEFLVILSKILTISDVFVVVPVFLI